jgi:hypothetical protein
MVLFSFNLPETQLIPLSDTGSVPGEEQSTGPELCQNILVGAQEAWLHDEITYLIQPQPGFCSVD